MKPKALSNIYKCGMSIDSKGSKPPKDQLTKSEMDVGYMSSSTGLCMWVIGKITSSKALDFVGGFRVKLTWGATPKVRNMVLVFSDIKMEITSKGSGSSIPKPEKASTEASKSNTLTEETGMTTCVKDWAKWVGLSRLR
jgi:hypothetical protein